MIISAFYYVVNEGGGQVMKKAGLFLILLTLVFCTGMVGFLFGRYHSGEILVSSHISPAAPKSAENHIAESAVPSVTNGKININSATAEELAALPGIGTVLAQRIVDYRSEHGLFRSAEDLSNVKGIGAKKLESIRQYIIVAGN
jgi:comEA protein